MAGKGVLSIKIIGDDSGLKKTLGGVSGRLDKFGGKMQGAGMALTKGLTLPLAAAGAGFLALRNDAAELESRIEKTKIVFGEQTAVVKDWAKENAGAMGLTSNEAAGLAANFGDLLIPMGFTREAAAGMSTDVVGLSGALSAWTGGTKSAAEVSAILSQTMLGEREGLKELGISVTEADVSAQLLKDGTSELTGNQPQQAKASATQKLIFDKSKDAQDAFSDSTETLSEKQLKSKAAMAQVKETLGTALVPILSTVSGIVATIAGAFNSLPGPIQIAILAFAGILAVVGPLLLLVGPIAGIFTAIAAAGGIAAIAVAAFGTVVAIATSPITLIIVAVLALAGAAYMIYKHWDGIAEFFGDLWGTIKDTTVRIWDYIKNFLSELWDGIKESFQLMWDTIKATFGAARSWIESVPGKILAAIGDVTTLLLQKGKDVLMGLWNGIKWIWTTYVSIWMNIGGKIKSAVGNLSSALYQAGKDVLGGLWQGMKDMWGGVLDWAKGIADKLGGAVKKVLGIDSPSKVMIEVGKNTMLGLEEGMKSRIPDVMSIAAEAGISRQL